MSLVIASSGFVTITIDWRNNLRVSEAIIVNNEAHSVAVQIYNDLGVLVFEETFATGIHTRSIQGSASRYVDIIEIAPDDFEYILNGFSLRLKNPA